MKNPCWFCGKTEGDLFWEKEFDTVVHLDCVREALKNDPRHGEADLMTYLLPEDEQRFRLGVLLAQEEDITAKLRDKVTAIEEALPLIREIGDAAYKAAVQIQAEKDGGSDDPDAFGRLRALRHSLFKGGGQLERALAKVAPLSPKE